MTVGNTEVISLAGQRATTTITQADQTIIKSDSLATDGSQKHVTATINRDWKLGIKYAVQTGTADMEIVSDPIYSPKNGDIYSNGNLNLSGQFKGSITSAKKIARVLGNGLSIGTNSSSYAWAPVIRYASTTGTFYCQTGEYLQGGKTCNTSKGTPPTLGIPGSDSATLDDWKSTSAVGGIYHGDYNIATYANVSLGPKVIDGNLNIGANSTLTLTGNVYVKGGISIGSHSNIILDPSYGYRSGVLIADGYIVGHSQGILTGSGQAGSYLVIVSLCSNSSCWGADNNSIFYSSDGGSVVIIAPLGRVEMGGSASVSGIAAQAVEFGNNVSVVNNDYFATGLIFTGAPTSTRLNILSWKELGN
jgi:hypothetical protein